MQGQNDNKAIAITLRSTQRYNQGYDLSNDFLNLDNAQAKPEQYSHYLNLTCDVIYKIENKIENKLQNSESAKTANCYADKIPKCLKDILKDAMELNKDYHLYSPYITGNSYKLLKFKSPIFCIMNIIMSKSSVITKSVSAKVSNHVEYNKDADKKMRMMFHRSITNHYHYYNYVMFHHRSIKNHSITNHYNYRINNKNRKMVIDFVP